jgi:hypothetical protein
VSGFVEVYRKDTGEKVRIPAHWLGSSLGKPFRKTPLQRAADSTPKPAGGAATDDTGKDK